LTVAGTAAAVSEICNEMQVERMAASNSALCVVSREQPVIPPASTTKKWAFVYQYKQYRYDIVALHITSRASPVRVDPEVATVNEPENASNSPSTVSTRRLS